MGLLCACELKSEKYAKEASHFLLEQTVIRQNLVALTAKIGRFKQLTDTLLKHEGINICEIFFMR